MEGYLIKLKSLNSRKFFTNYVKRYFILDLQNMSLTYKVNQKTLQIRRTYHLNDIVKVHRHSTIGQNHQKVAKNLLLDWQYDFMLEVNEARKGKKGSSDNVNNQSLKTDTRTLILLSNSESLYH